MNTQTRELATINALLFIAEQSQLFSAATTALLQQTPPASPAEKEEFLAFWDPRMAAAWQVAGVHGLIRPSTPPWKPTNPFAEEMLLAFQDPATAGRLASAIGTALQQRATVNRA